MRRYGDGLFGVALDDDRRVRIGIGRLIAIREGPAAENVSARGPTFLTRLAVALPMLVIVKLDRTVQVEPSCLQLPQVYPTLYRFG
jgi:hypothetical protein